MTIDLATLSRPEVAMATGLTYQKVRNAKMTPVRGRPGAKPLTHAHILRTVSEMPAEDAVRWLSDLLFRLLPDAGPIGALAAEAGLSRRQALLVIMIEAQGVVRREAAIAALWPDEEYIRPRGAGRYPPRCYARLRGAVFTINRKISPARQIVRTEINDLKLMEMTNGDHATPEPRRQHGP